MMEIRNPSSSFRSSSNEWDNTGLLCFLTILLAFFNTVKYFVIINICTTEKCIFNTKKTILVRRSKDRFYNTFSQNIF